MLRGSARRVPVKRVVFGFYKRWTLKLVIQGYVGKRLVGLTVRSSQDGIENVV